MPGPYQFEMHDGRLFRKCDFCNTFLVVNPETNDFIEPHECSWMKEMRLLRAGMMALNALKMVEWTNAIDGGTICPWCGERESDGHSPYCLRENALADAGEK